MFNSYEPIEMHPKVQSPTPNTTFAYNCRIDAYNKKEKADDSEIDISWDIKNITDHRVYNQGESSYVKLKVHWTNNDKTWEHLDDVIRHDIQKVLLYALDKKLSTQPGWKWIKSFVEADEKFQDMKAIYLASKSESKFKFGVEVAKSPKHALQLDEKEQNEFWK